MLFLFLQKGPNKTPVAAICLTSLVTMAFVLVGQVNVLAPIVTINFMLTYVAVDYSYFSLSVGPRGLPQEPEVLHGEGTGALCCSEHLLLEKAFSYGSEGTAPSLSEGTLLEFTRDMDQLLQLTGSLESGHPRRGESEKGKGKKAPKQTLQDSFLLDLESPAFFPAEDSDGLPTASGTRQNTEREGARPGGACGEQLFLELSNQLRPSGEGECFGHAVASKFAVTSGSLTDPVITTLPQVLRPVTAAFRILVNFDVYFKKLYSDIS